MALTAWRLNSYDGPEEWKSYMFALGVKKGKGMARETIQNTTADKTHPKGQETEQM